VLHTTRKWCVVDIDDADKLAELLTEYTHTLCSGFRYKGYLFLNDSTSENGAQEYAVVKEDTKQQVESITFSWCTLDEAKTYIQRIAAGEFDDQAWDLGYDISRYIETPDEHGVCPFCA